MPPKGKDAKKGAPQGNYKAGKPLKDILPANMKAPREGTVVKLDGEPSVQREFEYEPLAVYPEWPGNDDAKTHDFTAGCEKDEEGNVKPFVDETEINLPPSFKEFQRETKIWLRPVEYIREVLHEQEVNRLKKERRRQMRTRKTIRKQNLMALSGHTPEDIPAEQMEFLNKQISVHVTKESINANPCVISHLERLETEEEVRRRKEEEERKAAMEKQTKKKAPAKSKGEPIPDPMDEPQMIKVPIENSLDLGFSMPSYTKWVTSQFQLAKDRYMTDVDTGEQIWQRIYPQENGLPVLSASGKYWVKLRFMGKERLIEIDDRIPCDVYSKPIFPRTNNIMELWPQLLMKALTKVYSYKWYTKNAHFDKEIGDGSIIYSLTGLIAEHIAVNDFEKDAVPLFRKLLSDESYFGHKAYLTCYCGEDFRPKLPSHLSNLNMGLTNKNMDNISETFSDSMSDATSMFSYNTSHQRLNKLRDAASLAISVTTGKKLSVKKNQNASNVIPGFGYALLDFFENEFVDMDSVIQQKNEIEEVKSPFKSPSKRRATGAGSCYSPSPSKRDTLERREREGSVSKDEYKRKRREEKRERLESLELKERQPPKQFSLLQVKTAVKGYPTINYVSKLSSDEIYQGKRCLMNHWRRTPESESARQLMIERQFSIKKRRKTGKFALNVLDAVSANQDDCQSPGLKKTPIAENKKHDASQAVLEDVESEMPEQKEENKPRNRALGGVWLESSDFPHAFTNLIVYHNLTKYQHTEFYSDIWSDGASPFTSNEKDVYLKLELDEEALAEWQKKHSKPEQSVTEEGEEKKDSQSQIEASLPGEITKEPETPDNLFLAYSPYPTKQPYEVLPRYFMRFNSTDLPEGVEGLDVSLTKYLEGRKLTLGDNLTKQKTLWLKPNMNAPYGFSMWVGAAIRKIEAVPRQDYLSQVKGYHTKTYTCDFLPQQKGKNHLFTKHEFKIPTEDTRVNIRVNCNNDRYLLDYMRIKIVDKSSSITEASKHITCNSLNLENLALPPNDKGYTLIVEGNMPYNTTEGQLQIEVQSNQESFELHELISCEPVEYTDTYQTSKYGIIFKEKIFTSPVDHTSVCINVRLLKDGVDMDNHGVKRYFNLEVKDNGKVIFKKKGSNQINLTHFVFRANQGLPESSETGEEVKHNYVIQATFDHEMWPECKTHNEHTEGISWVSKWFTSETLALVKDTDKEDKEARLKASWETAEPGRAEKATKSRQRFLLMKKQKSGEELTDEEKDFLKEKRERVKKKDLEEQVPVKGSKGKAPAKGAPVKAGKHAAVVEKHDEEDEYNKRVLPEPEDHVNNNIVEFLNHFKSERLIRVICTEPKNDHGRKRSDEELKQMADEKAAQQAKEKESHDNFVTSRNTLKESRQAFKENVLAEVEKARKTYKEKLVENVEKRNGYRDLISTRKEKEKALSDLLATEKIDINALTLAIEQAIENLVSDKVIERANKQLEWLKYSKEVEQSLQEACAAKVRADLVAVLEKIDRENVIIEPKILNDAKNLLAKGKLT